MLSPYSPQLTGLGLSFMGLSGSMSGFLEVQVLLSHLWEKENEEKKRRREGRKKEIEKEWKEVRKEGRRNKKKIGGKIRRMNFNKN